MFSSLPEVNVYSVARIVAAEVHLSHGDGGYFEVGNSGDVFFIIISIWSFIILQLRARRCSSEWSGGTSCPLLFFVFFAPAVHLFGPAASLGLVVKVITARTTAGRAIRRRRRRGRRWRRRWRGP